MLGAGDTVSWAGLSADVMGAGTPLTKTGAGTLALGYAGNTPVSYTHLDVYKRQPESLHARIQEQEHTLYPAMIARVLETLA